MIENVDGLAGAHIRGDDSLVNLYNCVLGYGTTVAPFVEIQSGVRTGYNCKISSHTFICSGVTLGANVFVGHGVMFTNDKYPTIAPRPDYLVKTQVGDNVSIGSGATILPVWIGDGAIIGAGSVVVHDVAPYSIVVGNPARVTHQFDSLESRNAFVEYHYRNRLS